ncbi:gas vesicle protein [Nostoc sp. ChiQUE01b]|uniref:gas vesicle protein n=1 Tax=Nostoc sp. ChiQUE01b TaxID=3075376 RepID=UPI002AD36535|nr:gas vesicle protein [Nostoc sp. ChiQUE01b]MDZ8262865.1 gas vesicle protein [Nostoc sp. ChiQUE01b]
MKHIRNGGLNRPKISTMPRLKSEASEQLKLYKMVSDRQRIQQELKFMTERLEQLKQHLSDLDTQIQQTELSIQNLRQSPPSQTQTMRVTPTNNTIETLFHASHKAHESNSFDTFYLDI